MCYLGFTRYEWLSQLPKWRGPATAHSHPEFKKKKKIVTLNLDIVFYVGSTTMFKRETVVMVIC